MMIAMLGLVLTLAGILLMVTGVGALPGILLLLAGPALGVWGLVRDRRKTPA